jgi:TonB family protein
MKKLIFILLLLLISGCSIFKPDEPVVIQPKLIKQYPLPALTQNIYKDNFEFFCEMMIDANGDVERVKLLSTSGDEIWDTLAVQSLLKWKYQPAIYDGSPIKMLVRTKITVVFTGALILSLAEIELDNYQLADSVYKELQRGKDFSELVSKFSISSSKNNKGMLGEVNIKLYAKNISNALSQLKPGEYTQPLNYGEHFIIFKRLN